MASERVTSGRAIIDSFVARIEQLIAGDAQAPLAYGGSVTLQRYALTQLGALRRELDRVDAEDASRT